VDLHEEPFSTAVHQWLKVISSDTPVVMYTAQNVAKRYPPPFAFYERKALGRASALYPCSRQAASVARGKGFAGHARVIPLGFDPSIFHKGQQSLDARCLTLAHVGRLVPEKGPIASVQVLSRINKDRPARLRVVGEGHQAASVRGLADSIGLRDRLQIESWRSPADLAETYRQTHVVLVPSVATTTWTEQFGRVLVEAQACGAVVVAYASGAIPEVLAGAGIMVPSGDVFGLAEAVSGLLNDPDRYQALRTAGLRLSETRTWDEVASRQIDVYEQAIGDRGVQVPMSASPRARRSAAIDEFGLPAALVGGLRPFALPLLRNGGAVARALATVLDTVAEARAAFVVPRTR
jgi:glycosyltransferase involved in cell wall biosynthesis